MPAGSVPVKATARRDQSCAKAGQARTTVLAPRPGPRVRGEQEVPQVVDHMWSESRDLKSQLTRRFR